MGATDLRRMLGCHAVDGADQSAVGSAANPSAGADRIYPGLIFFSKPYGKHGEPYRGYVLTFLVSFLFLLIADLNTIAPLITNFYLASYALINFCTFHAAFIKHISWRPTFRCYNTWVSLLGFLMCIIIMMVISWVMTLITITIFLTLYLIVVYRKPEANWGSSTDAQRYKETVTTLLQMTHRAGQESVKTYNPQLLILAGKPFERPALFYIGHLLTVMGSFMIVADIEENISTRNRKARQRLGDEWLQSLKTRGFYVVVDSIDLEHGARALYQASGLGRMAPNVLLLGYKNDWLEAGCQEIISYFNILQQAFEHQLAVTVLRVPFWARSYQRSVTYSTKNSSSSRIKSHILAEVMNSDSNIDLTRGTQQDIDKEYSEISELDKQSENSNQTLTGRAQVKDEVIDQPRIRYQTLSFQNKNVLDAWCLYDDGGLNILLPYIIARRGKEKMKLRIFALTKNQHANEKAQIQRCLLRFT